MIIKKFASFILCYYLFSQVIGQTVNRVEYDYTFEFKPGLYVSFSDFRNNAPIPFESLVYPDFAEDDFYFILDTAKTIIFNDKHGVTINTNISKLWGFSRNGKPYIYWSNKVNLIPFVGSISHFITTIKVTYSAYNDPFYDPYYYSPSARVYQSEELRQFIIDMETGKIMEYNTNNVESILQREPAVLEDFNKLKKRKKAKQLFYFVRLYNEKRALLINE